MAHNIELKLRADAREAKAGLQATAKAADVAAEEVKEFNETAASGEELERILKKHKDAFDAEAAAIKRANAELRERERRQKALAKAGGAGGAGGAAGLIGSAAMLGGKAGVIGAAVMAAGAGAFAAGSAVSAPAAEWEDAAARLKVTAGSAAGEVLEAVEELSVRYGVAGSELLKQGARLSKAGLSSEQAVKALESAVVAARGDVAQMEGILDILAEAVTRGTLEEDLMSRMEENGIELRRVLMRRFNMVKEDFDAALSAGKVDLQHYFAVIDELTGKGSEAQRAAEGAAASTGGVMRSLGRAWESIMRSAGDLLNEHIVHPLAEKALPAVKELAEKVRGWVHEDGGKAREIVPWVAEARAAESPREMAEMAATEVASAQYMAEVSGVMERQRAAAADARWGKMTLAARRAELGRITGLGEGVSVKGIDRLMGERAGALQARVAGGGLVYGDDMAGLQELERARELMVVLEEQEAVTKRQRTLDEDRLRVADRRRAMMLAEIAGDGEQLAALEREAELEKRVAEYRRSGVEAEEAAVMAAEEMDLERRVAEVRKSREARDEGQKMAGFVQTGLASVGGGGVSMRMYESQGLKVAQSTERNTAEVATGVKELVAEVKMKGLAGFTVLK